MSIQFFGESGPIRSLPRSENHESTEHKSTEHKSTEHTPVTPQRQSFDTAESPRYRSAQEEAAASPIEAI